MNWTFDLVGQSWTSGPYLIQGFLRESGEGRFCPYCITGKQTDFLEKYVITWPRHALAEAKDDCETHAAKLITEAIPL